MESVVDKLEMNLFDWPPLALVRYWVQPEIARGAEMVCGILLPVLCFVFMPAYRQFCNEPDPGVNLYRSIFFVVIDSPAEIS